MEKLNALIRRIEFATPKELGIVVESINRAVYLENDWNSVSVKSAYINLLSAIDAEIGNFSTYLAFGNEFMDYEDCSTDEQLTFNVRQALGNLNIAKEYFQNPPTLEKCTEVDEQPLITSKEEVVRKDEISTTDQNLIKGVKGLANFLGCGVTYAQAVINSKVLMKDGIQYKCGGWLFNKSKLEKLMKENPELLKDIHIKR